MSFLRGDIVCAFYQERGESTSIPYQVIVLLLLLVRKLLYSSLTPHIYIYIQRVSLSK